MRLLIVDDNELVSEFLASVALDSGWRVECARNETEFRARYQVRPPDAIFLDLQLGASDGIEQLRFLHRHDYRGAVALISGFDARVLEVARQIGDSFGLRIVAVIEKPARANRVRTVLKEIDESSGAAADTAAQEPARPASAGESISPSMIAAAISGGEMELHLQPIVSVSDYKARSAEGLIRWRHPVDGMVPPDGFIPIAEREEAVIDQLTRWVIETAASHHKRLAVLGFPIRICVNVSGMNLHSLDFPDQVAASLNSASVRPDVIGLEITETSAMRDPAATADILTRLRLKGFTLAIDDFGTGHSSLEALRRMPFSTVKIDKGFVTDIRSSRSSLMILRAMIALARDLGLECVAEGVESEAAASLLAELGVGNLQGYFFSRALPLAQFATWIRRWNLALIGRPATGPDVTADRLSPREVRAD